jgi:hypothetical protein
MSLVIVKRPLSCTGIKGPVVEVVMIFLYIDAHCIENNPDIYQHTRYPEFMNVVSDLLLRDHGKLNSICLDLDHLPHAFTRYISNNGGVDQHRGDFNPKNPIFAQISSLLERK